VCGIVAKSLKQYHKSLPFNILGRRVLCQPASQFGKLAKSRNPNRCIVSIVA
jgi:hypothetical protein